MFTPTLLKHIKQFFSTTGDSLTTSLILLLKYTPLMATLDYHTDIDSYASPVLDDINININSVTIVNWITTFPNQKQKRGTLLKA